MLKGRASEKSEEKEEEDAVDIGPETDEVPCAVVPLIQRKCVHRNYPKLLAPSLHGR